MNVNALEKILPDQKPVSIFARDNSTTFAVLLLTLDVTCKDLTFALAASIHTASPRRPHHHLCINSIPPPIPFIRWTAAIRYGTGRTWRWKSSGVKIWCSREFSKSMSRSYTLKLGVGRLEGAFVEGDCMVWRGEGSANSQTFSI